MLDKEFCSFLEFHLTKCFKYSEDDTIRTFWCDGVALPLNENDYSKKNINDKREVVLTAYIGIDGQVKYSLLIKFGPSALSKYALDLDIKECVLHFEKNDWYFVDKKNKQIIIQLI